ncbi:hypothetical protein AB0F15_42735 [Amycolatopsis sp. NPDC026612]|uniref:hypothetical protein n=1 Tax=Amycolatopsis sp. NPDC026612 TaxID=3155466 RepID=UPI0033ED9734
MNIIEAAAVQQVPSAVDNALAPLELVSAQRPASCWIDAAVVSARAIAAAERATAHEAANFAAQALMRAHGFGHYADAGVAASLNGSLDSRSFAELAAIMSASL